MPKADRDAGTIILDSQTTLSGIPPEAWDYRLGNRSALEWILDQHKEKKPKDPTIREKFDTYRFADYKGHRPAHARDARIGRNAPHHRGHAHSQTLGCSRYPALISREKCSSKST